MFAATDIPKGTTVVHFQPRCMSRKAWHQHIRPRTPRYILMGQQKDSGIYDAEHGRYLYDPHFTSSHPTLKDWYCINHSFSPNMTCRLTQAVYGEVWTPGVVAWSTTVDVPEGTELTFRYKNRNLGFKSVR